jgi:hypothetical protein
MLFSRRNVGLGKPDMTSTVPGAAGKQTPASWAYIFKEHNVMTTQNNWILAYTNSVLSPSNSPVRTCSLLQKFSGRAGSCSQHRNVAFENGCGGASREHCGPYLRRMLQ